MGDHGKKTSTKGRTKKTTSVSVSGIVKTSDGKYAVKLTIGGQTILVPAGGDKKPDVAKIKNRIAQIGSNISATTTPTEGGKLKVGLKGDDGSISFSGKKV